MIELLIGTVHSANPVKAIIVCSGVGYSVNISLALFDLLEKGKEAIIHTRAIYRETEQILFGFVSTTQRELFDSLLKVSGIGPKLSMGIVSGLQPEELADRINSADVVALTKLPGIGKKTAERMVLELGGKLKLDTNVDDPKQPVSVEGLLKDEALSALLSLGFSKVNAEKAIKASYKEFAETPTVENLIKSALKKSMG